MSAVLGTLRSIRPRRRATPTGGVRRAAALFLVEAPASRLVRRVGPTGRPTERVRVVLLSNPIAGRGRASAAVRSLRPLLEREGCRVVECEATAGGPSGLREALEGRRAGDRAGLLVVVGGDGTVQAAAGPAADLCVPLFHYPFGTENLFAREFGMRAEPASLLGAVRGGRVLRVDVARCNGRRFLLMCSVGLDANVVNRLARNRSGSISHLSYAEHIARELVFPSFGELTIEADGEAVVSGRPGMAVIANSRQYALRIDPARGASMTDGLLDVVYFPVSRRVGFLKWMALARLDLQRRAPGVVSVRARSVRVRAARPAAGRPFDGVFQMDGEAEPRSGRGSEPGPDAVLEFGVEPRALPVLLPAGVSLAETGRSDRAPDEPRTSRVDQVDV